MARKKHTSQKETLPFEIPPPKTVYAPRGKRRGVTPPPIWTENKAKLIERYLHYFVMVTKHGTYIDGFAGPQAMDHPDSWAAKLALEMEPKWLRHFHLFDNDTSKARCLQDLKTDHPDRDIRVFHTDFNQSVQHLLESGDIGEREAVFCLLDQQTFECDWATVETLARYQDPRRRKIELFYFLPNSWFERAVAAMHEDTTRDTLPRWWGRNDWASFAELRRPQRCQAFADRLKNDLGYAFVDAYAIRQQDDSGNIMYYMLHASDHEEAPNFMARAYRAVVDARSEDQFTFEFFATPPR